MRLFHHLLKLGGRCFTMNFHSTGSEWSFFFNNRGFGVQLEHLWWWSWTWKWNSLSSCYRSSGKLQYWMAVKSMVSSMGFITCTRVLYNCICKTLSLDTMGGSWSHCFIITSPVANEARIFSSCMLIYTENQVREFTILIICELTIENIHWFAVHQEWKFYFSQWNSWGYSPSLPAELMGD